MKLFKYYDNKQNRKLLFFIEAECILMADKEFEKETGINPVKAPWIGCTVEKV